MIMLAGKNQVSREPAAARAMSRPRGTVKAICMASAATGWRAGNQLPVETTGIGVANIALGVSNLHALPPNQAPEPTSQN